jgi:multiple sugar transport system ATP-binding protein
MASVHWERVGKEFPDGTVAVEDLSLDVADGEFVVLVGPSGSGKSTALRIAAGLEEASEGTIRIGERDVTDVPPRDRDIAMVFQTYALYPHMDVGDNLGFALKLRGEPRAEVASRTAESARRLGISSLLDRLPRQLSGGQRQRVALGRAIVRDPRAFLMDEPLSNLDAQLRVEMRAYISRLHRELGTTTIFVTHDQVEAMTMGDRVAVMREGRLEQVDEPQSLYDHPANAFVGGFIGSPAMNLLTARLERDGDGVIAAIGANRVAISERALPHFPAALGSLGDDVVIGVRPEALRAEAAPDAPTLSGKVLLVESLGSDVLVHLELDAPAVLTGERLEAARELGAVNGSSASGDGLVATDRARLTARLPVAQAPDLGATARLAVDTERLHFFDPGDGRALR